MYVCVRVSACMCMVFTGRRVAWSAAVNTELNGEVCQLPLTSGAGVMYSAGIMTEAQYISSGIPKPYSTTV